MTDQALPLIELTDKILALPVVHSSVEITVLVRRVFEERPPSAVVIELPTELQHQLREAIQFAETYPVIKMKGDPAQYLILEPLEPLIEGFRSAVESAIPVFCVDRLSKLPSLFNESFPDTYSLTYFRLDDLYRQYKKSKIEAPIEIQLIDRVREISMTDALKHISAVMQGSILFLCGFRHLVEIEKLLQLSDEDYLNSIEELKSVLYPHEAIDNISNELQKAVLGSDQEPLNFISNLLETGSVDDVEIVRLSPESGEVLSQPGFFNERWLELRTNVAKRQRFNRIDLQRQVYQIARQSYEFESGEILGSQREKLFFRFARNWAIIQNQLLPSAYQLIMAAKACVNDNFARIFYDTLIRFNPNESPLPKAEIRLNDLYQNTKMIRFRTKLNKKPKIAPPQVRKSIQRERYPGEWKNTDFMGMGGMCSYPPEDIIIEDFAKYLQQKATALIKSKETKTQPFTTSLLDGVDFRETIRNLYQDRVFVKENRNMAADAGSVLVIYSQDELAHPWQVVWWGEHDQESDMAFFATPIHSHMVGPGISRCIYGGFLLTYPPGRLGDIWNDRFFKQFNSNHERLLAAAIIYNEKKIVVHIADQRPSSRMNQLAGRFGQRIIHLPKSSVNPVQLNRVRRFHVLDDRYKRHIADDFIW